jgi:hypothetical protein
MIRLAYLAITAFTLVAAMRANLMIDQARFQGGITWTGLTVFTGLLAMRLGWLLASRPQSTPVEVSPDDRS